MGIMIYLKKGVKTNLISRAIIRNIIPKYKFRRKGWLHE